MRRSECKEQIAQTLSFDGELSGLEVAMVNAFTDCCEEAGAAAPPLEAAFEVRVGRWFIRDGDMDLFGAVRDSVVSLAAAGLLLDSPEAQVVAANTGFCLFLLRLYRGVGTLTDDQVAVVACLDLLGRSAELDAIAARLSTDQTRWDAQTTAEVLRSLEAVRTNRNIVALVEQDSDERWCLLDI